MKQTVYVIIGPTASGKSGVGIELAKKINGVVISADSMQIYEKLDIGTAKVTNKEACGIEHELIDIIDVTDKFSVSEYKELCYKKIDEILAKNKTPIIVGGTGLYINAVVNNMTFEKVDEKKEEQVDRELELLIQDKSEEELYQILVQMDKEAANLIDKNNTKRVIRAIKMNLLGVKKSDVDNRKDLWHKNESKYNFKVYLLDMPREMLYERINKRVDLMVELGVLKEAKYLLELSRENKDITAIQAIGYKEFFGYLEGNKTLEECTQLLKQKTRNYAKRQLTWFNKLNEKKIIDATKTKDEIIMNILKENYGEN